MSGYGHGGASKKKKAFKAFANELLSGSPRQDIDNNNYDLRQRSRLLYMTEPIAAALINQPRNNVVGLGLFCKPRVDYNTLGISKESAEILQKKYEQEYTLWAEDKNACDAIGMNNMYGLQQLAFTSWLCSGDCFALFKNYERQTLRPYGLRIHLVEADRCCTPTTGMSTSSMLVGKAKNGNIIYDGVEVNNNGLVVAYYICNKYPQDSFSPEKKTTEWTRIPTIGEATGLPNILHIMNSERPEQYRGVPFLSKVIEPLLQIRRYREAELTAAVIQAFFTVFITNNPETDGTPNLNEVGVDEDETGKSNRSDEYEMGVGNINFLDEGEDIKFAQPTHPESGFSGFCDTVIQHIASALGLPKETVILAFNSSYSASRAALQEAWKTYRMFRKWFVDDFCQPIYEKWFAEATALGRIDAPGFFNDPIIRRAYTRVEWIGPAPGMIDPTKDISSSKLAADCCFSTSEAETLKLFGGDIYANIAQRGNEIKLMEQAGITRYMQLQDNPYLETYEDNADKGDEKGTEKEDKEKDDDTDK